MTGPSAVSPTSQSPEWDVTLTDGTDSVGFVLGAPGAEGFVKDPRRIQRTPIQRTALKTAQGGNKYDDLEWPYMTIPQDDWSGGRGMLTLDDDASRYFDGYRIDTSLAGKAILGPLDVTGTVAYSGGGTNTPGIFFEYKGALYFVTAPLAGTASTLYINGDRGAADANTGALTTLVDATKTGATAWTVNAWANCIVKIVAGPGVEEEQNWRTISSNTANTLTVSPAWNIEHTTSTEYVILKSNTWTAISCSPLFLDKATDVAVAGDFVYFCYEGDNVLSYVQRYQEYNNAGVWTRRAATESIWADQLCSTTKADGKHILWGAYSRGDKYRRHVWRYDVPARWGALYQDLGEAFPTKEAWDTRSITNVTQTVSGGDTTVAFAAGFSTGIAAVKDFDEPVLLTGGDAIGVLTKVSGTTTVATDYSLKYDDMTDLGTSGFAPTKVLADRWFSPTNCYYWDDSETTKFPANKMDNAVDGLNSTSAEIDSMTTADAIYIGSSLPFSAIYVFVGNANSTANTTMKLEWHKGNAWYEYTISDGTVSGGISLAQDGIVTFSPRLDWQPSIVNSVEAYWVRMTFDEALDSDVTIEEFWVLCVEQDMPNAIDGAANRIQPFTLRSTDYMYIGGSDKYDTVTFDFVAGEVNTVVSSLTAQYWDGDLWTSLTITDGTKTGAAPNEVTLSQDGSITYTIPYNWATCTVDGVEGYFIRLIPNVDIYDTNVYVMMSLYTISLARVNNVTLNFPAMAAGSEWEWVQIAITANRYPYPDQSQVKSVGLYANVVPGVRTMTFSGGWRLLNTTPEYIEIPTSNRINRIIAYGSSSGLGVNPYVITDDGVFEIQQENDNAIVKLPIGEISAFADNRNGDAVCTNDVYLYFNLGRKIERYYNGNIEDIGPDLDAGLPANRQGDVTCLVSYPGRVYASIDAGTGKYSFILLYKGNGWHEVYRAAAGESIYNMHYQAIPGSSTGRLWFAQSDDLKFIYVSTSPDTDTDYRYTSTGYIITGWIYGGMQTIKKVFDSLTVMLENTTSSAEYIQAYYQLDEMGTYGDRESTWVTITGNFDQIVEKIALATARPSGRRLRLKIEFVSSLSTKTPILIAYSLDIYGVVSIKYQYSWTALLSEYNGYDVNLDGNDQIALGYNNAAETALAKLDAWADAATVLTQNSRFSLYDTKTVIPTAVAHVPVDINSEVQLERHVLSVTCHDL